jgi:hypothetical protein
VQAQEPNGFDEKEAQAQPEPSHKQVGTPVK